MLTFYSLPISNYGAKVEIALRLKGLAFETLPPPDGYGSAAYKAIVPAGTIPAIVDGDLVLAESETIVEYLEEAYPIPPLLPEGAKARARCRQVARFHDTRLEPVLRTLFPHLPPSGRDDAFVERQLTLLRTRLADLAAMVRPATWLCGDAVTLADLAYAPTFLMARAMHGHLGLPFELPPSLAAWERHAVVEPAWRPVLKAQAAATQAWLEARR